MNIFNRLFKKHTTGITNCVFIGINAGVNITSGDGIVIIGDDVKDLDRSQKDVLFIGDKVAIGKTIQGVSINIHNLQDVIKELYDKHTVVNPEYLDNIGFGLSTPKEQSFLERTNENIGTNAGNHNEGTQCLTNLTSGHVCVGYEIVKNNNTHSPYIGKVAMESNGTALGNLKIKND